MAWLKNQILANASYWLPAGPLVARPKGDCLSLSRLLKISTMAVTVSRHLHNICDLVGQHERSISSPFWPIFHQRCDKKGSLEVLTALIYGPLILRSLIMTILVPHSRQVVTQIKDKIVSIAMLAPHWKICCQHWRYKRHHKIIYFCTITTSFTIYDRLKETHRGVQSSLYSKMPLIS